MTFDDYLATLPSRGTAYDAAKEAVLEDRDAWLDLGVFLLPITLQSYPDRRSLPVWRVPAGGAWERPAPAIQRIPARY